MQPFETIQAYCNEVCAQIRWKKAKGMIATEIENHLCDQRDAYMAKGEDESVATKKAITQMGDAVLIGQEMDKTHKPRPQWFMLALTAVFMALGMAVNYFLSIEVGGTAGFHVWPYILAFAAFTACYYLDFTILGRYARKIYLLVLLCAIGGIALLGVGAINGELVWFFMGRFYMPFSYLSFIFPLAFALFVYSMRGGGLGGILISGAAYLPFAVILLLVPTLSGLLLYTIAALTVLCFAICRGWFGISKKQGLLVVCIPTAVAVCLGSFFVIESAPHRLNIFLNPQEDIRGMGYMYALVRDVIARAALVGEGGLPQGIADITLMPNISTDYALLYFIHRFGLVVLLGTVLLVLLFVFVCIYKAIKEKSVLGSMIALSVGLTFAVQAGLYILDNLGYSMVSSLSLPFISYGNSALVIDAALVGFMLSVFRTGEVFSDCLLRPAGDKAKDEPPIFSYADGKLTITLKRNV